MASLNMIKEQIPSVSNLQSPLARICANDYNEQDKESYQYSHMFDELYVSPCSSNTSASKHKNISENKTDFRQTRTLDCNYCGTDSLNQSNTGIFTNVEPCRRITNSHDEVQQLNDKLFVENENKLKKSFNILPKQLSNKFQDNNLGSSKTLCNEITGPSASSSEFKAKSNVNQTLSMKRADAIQQNQVKTKLRSMWNNVKYGWRVKREVNLKVDSAIWLLGRCYHNKHSESSSISQDVSRQLKLDLLSKIWLTYRINFQTIPGTEFVSDSGWGCMLRCGQMMMAQALVCHVLGRDWRITYDQPEEHKYQYKMILRWFGDSLSDNSIFSLHHLVFLGVNYGRKPGDWYGPTHVAQVLRDALLHSQKNHPVLKDICMHVALDGIVFKQDIEDLCCDTTKENCSNIHIKQQPSLYPKFPTNDSILKDKSKEYKADWEDACPSYSEFGPPSFNTANGGWKSLILFVSVRLGNDRINPFYVPCLKSLLAYEQCIGIIGGRPKHALYFIGWQEEKLIHLDPHACQPFVDVEKEDFNEKSFHSSSIRTISFTEMDPSCAIGFYFKTREQFEHFVEKFSEITAPLKRNLDYPIFALVNGRRTDVEEIDSSNAYTLSNISILSSTSHKEDDDYILL